MGKTEHKAVRETSRRRAQSGPGDFQAKSQQPREKAEKDFRTERAANSKCIDKLTVLETEETEHAIHVQSTKYSREQE